MLFYLLLIRIISVKSTKCGEGELIIPDGISSIPVSEYENCIEFTGKLIIPENIITIKQRAFYGCTGLTGELIIPDSVKEIESEAFLGCTGFTSLKLGKKLNAIRRRAFENCTQMKGQLTIYENIKMIDSYAFYQTNFNEIIFEYAFIGCGVDVFPPQVHGIFTKKTDIEIPRNQICGITIEIPKKSKSKTWIWIVIVVIILVLIALFFILKKIFGFSFGCIWEQISNCCRNNNDSEAEDLESIPRKAHQSQTNHNNKKKHHKNDSNEKVYKVYYFTNNEKNKNHKKRQRNKRKTDEELDEYYSDENVKKRRRKNVEDVEDIIDFGNDIEDEEIIPYAPENLDEDEVVKLENGQRMINLGKRCVIHATTYEAAQNIIKEKSLRLGKSGMFGAGIYFANSKRIARNKCIIENGIVAAYVQCVVDFGNALILDKPYKSMCLEKLDEIGCNSVMGRANIGRDWEFVVYERNRTQPKQLILLNERL